MLISYTWKLCWSEDWSW